MSFYPKSEKIPAQLISDGFLFVPLHESHVELDYAAVMESRIYLNIWRQSSWPTPDFSLDDNLEDLLLHHREHVEKKAFTFTILNEARNDCLGCVYITPFDSSHPISYVQRSQCFNPAMIRFWVRSCHLNTELERQISSALIFWIKRTWKFDLPLFMTSIFCVQQQRILNQIGLVEAFTCELKGKYTGTWKAFV